MIEPLLLPKITDYWDAAKNAVPHFAENLESLSPADAHQTGLEIRAGVGEHLRVLPDSLLGRVAFAVAEDLYRTANTVSVWNSAVADYLNCSAGTFFTILSQRGLRLHYAIDNSFQELQRPLLLFPGWFRACGIHYECPQFRESEGTPRGLSREQCTGGLREAFTNRRHYLMLDADSDESSFEAPLEQIDTTGVLTIIRNEAPDPGSKAIAYLSGKPLA